LKENHCRVDKPLDDDDLITKEVNKANNLVENVL
jgi:hypothetical protein